MFNLKDYLFDYVRALHRLNPEQLEQAAAMIVSVWTDNRTVFLCGNGGSASSAGHLAADLIKLTAPASGRRLRAMALTDSVSAISAIANDQVYDEVFAEQLRAFAQSDDVVIGISTSGASPNVLRAVEYANTIGARTIAMTGNGGGPLGYLARHAIVIESADVQHVEDATMVAGHMLCLRVRDALATLHRSPSGAADEVPAAAASWPDAASA